MVLASALALAPALALAQAAQKPSIRGLVTDPSGAVVPGATITLRGPAGSITTTRSASDGTYSFSGLAPGDYAIQAAAPELALPSPLAVKLSAGVQTLDLKLEVLLPSTQVNVQAAQGPTVSTAAENNANALVLRGADLEALSDDPEDLAADLQALAGPSAGPNGGAIYIDGFSGGELPSKDEILEIRINQNPFSPEYDKLGFGRIEITTKPGSNKFHGFGRYNIGDSVWNSRNPYAAQKAPFLLQEYGGSLSGPLGRATSFFLDAGGAAIDNGAIINGSTLDPVTLAIINPYTQVFSIPQRRFIVSPRIDWQAGEKDSISARYRFERADIRDAGVGGFNLVSTGLHNHSDSQTVQLSNTAILSSNTVNETRFQFYRLNLSTLALEPGPSIDVLGSFSGGGSPTGQAFNTENDYELQNVTNVLRGRHAWRWGGRLRAAYLTDTSPTNFGGTFTFSGGPAPELDPSGNPVIGPDGQPVQVNIDSIESYRRTLLFQSLGFAPDQVRQRGGGASQFSIAAGAPSLGVNQWDAGVFFGDDWRARPNFTLSYGLRYEAQTNIGEARGFAPRLGLAWAPGRASGGARPKNVIRAGFGVFYDRFPLADTLAAERYNGVVQQQVVVTNPDFYPLVPPLASFATSGATATGRQVIQKVSPDLQAPYLMQSALAFERQLPGHTTMALTFADTHGLHQLRSADINAPLPGTYNPADPSSSAFPRGNPDPVFLMESAGLYNQTQWIVNFNSQPGKSVSLFGSYLYNHAMSNTDGLGTFPANPYSMAGEYGPASTDIRNRLVFGGSINTRWGFRFNPFLTANSGAPFDITAGQDLYGDTLFNTRPGIALDPAKPGVIETPYGLLDPNPSPGETILPRNFGRGPAIVLFNLRISKVFAFGRAERGGGVATGGHRRGETGPFSLGGSRDEESTGRRYNLAISMSIRNLLNRNNPGPIIGNIESPSFGMANQPYGVNMLGGTGFSESADNRRLELQTRFTF